MGDCSGYKQLTGPSCLINNSDPVELAHFTLSQLNCVDPTHLSQAIIHVYSIKMGILAGLWKVRESVSQRYGGIVTLTTVAYHLSI